MPETAHESKNLELARRFIMGVLAGQDPAAFDELVADDVWISTGLKPDAPITSKAEYGTVLAGTLGKAFSDGHLTIEDMTETNDGRVLARFTATVTHSGEIFGVPPTGRTITMSELHLMRFRDGKLVENYVGALNPLGFEMLYADHITKLIF